MRLTNTIRIAILRNLVADHEVAKRAEDVMRDSQKLALDIIKSAMPQGVTTMAQLRKWMAVRKSDMEASPFFNANTYSNSVSFAQNDRKITYLQDATFYVNFAGMARTMSVVGDFWHRKLVKGRTDRIYRDAISPDLGDICRGLELRLFLDIVEYEDGMRIPFYMPREQLAFAEGHDFIKRQDALDQRRRSVRDQYDELEGVVMAALNKHTSDTKLVKAWPQIEQYIPGVEKKSTEVALDVRTLNAICGLPK